MQLDPTSPGIECPECETSAVAFKHPPTFTIRTEGTGYEDTTQVIAPVRCNACTWQGWLNLIGNKGRILIKW